MTSIPFPVTDLLAAAAEVPLEEMVEELDCGELALAVEALDHTSRLIAVAAVRELVGQHGEAGRFREAAALDLLVDRMQWSE